MADENMTQDPDAQGKKITVKLKPLALEKATGEQTAANVNIPTAPAGASASATVKFNHKAVAASEPEMPTAQDLAKQTIKLAPPPRTGLPKPPAPLPSASAAPASPVLKKATQIVKAVETPEAPASPVLKKATQVVKAVETPAAEPAAPAAVETPAAAATQAVKKPGLVLPKKPAAEPAAEPAAPAAVETPAAAATQAVKKPGLILPKKPAAEPAAAPAEESEPKKPGLILPKKPAAEPAAAPAEESEPKKPGLILPKKPAAEPAAPAGIDLKKPGSGDADAKRVQEEGLKPKEGGSGLGLKKVEKVAEEDLPDSLKQDGAVPASKAKVILGPQNEPGPVFTTIVVLAFIILLIGVYVQFFGYAKWMPEMDAHINSLPAPPTGVFPK